MATALPYMVISARFGKRAQGRNVSGTARSVSSPARLGGYPAGRPVRPVRRAGRRARCRERSEEYLLIPPVLGEEHIPRRDDELLQGPPALEPHAAAEGRIFLHRAVTSRDVGEEDVADVGPRVPGEHGVDCFRELRAAGLVDAACVDPDIRMAVGASVVAAIRLLS